MRVSYNWLKDFVKIDLAPEELAEKLTLAGFEVGKIYYADKGIKNVVAGKIIKIEKHPQADKLQLTKIDIGKKILNIVCGAFNIKEGDKVPVALPSGQLSNGLIIQKSKIRGIDSEGMLCAEDELEIGEDHTGIYILSEEVKVGEDIRKVLNLDDAIFEVELPANRGDCQSHLGIAREILALVKKTDKKELIKEIEKLDRENQKLRKEKNKLKNESANLKIEIKDKKLCPKYTARIVRGVEIKDSPQWLKNRLLACGIRPINNIVDITNYVMLELGQPLHAFDFNKIENLNPKSQILNPKQIPNPKFQTKEIIIRKAKEGEKIITIDEKERELDDSMLVIADFEKPIAIAGVMGGQNSEISEQTKDIVLESAQFNPSSIRRTSRQLGLRSESSTRFERGVDWNITEVALDRATELICELAKGKPEKEKIFVTEKPLSFKKIIKVAPNFISQFLGLEIKKEKIVQILKSLGFVVSQSNSFAIPSWREDISLPVDLAEEVGRIYDYNKMKPTLPLGELKPPLFNQEIYLENKIKDILIGCGFDEVYNYSFHGETRINTNTDTNLDTNKNTNKNEYLEVVNPLNPEQKYLRRSLAPRIIETVGKNLNNFDNVKVFEIGKVFLPTNKELPEERKKVVLAIGSKETADNLFFVLKGVVSVLSDRLNVPSILIENEFLEDFGGGKIVYIAEFDFQDILKDFGKIKKYQPIPIYPKVTRDLAIVIDKNIPYLEIEKAIKNIDPLIKKIELFDVFASEKLGKDKRGLAFHLDFQAENRTLRAEEADEIIEKILKELEKRFGAKIRV